MGAKAVVRRGEVEEVTVSEWNDIRLEHEQMKDTCQAPPLGETYKRYVTGEWADLRTELEKQIEETVKRHNLAVEELTEKQFVSAIKQAIECGDFTRLVRVTDGGQCVVYMPFEREQKLESQVAELKQQVEALTRATDPPRTIAIDEGTKI